MGRGSTRERWAREAGTAILAAAILATIAARPLRWLLRKTITGRREMADTKKPGADKNQPNPPGIEGEGSRTAAQGYREGVEEHLRKGNVEEEAERAARDLDENPEELRRAEEEGKRRSAGDLPSDLD